MLPFGFTGGQIIVHKSISVLLTVALGVTLSALLIISLGCGSGEVKVTSPWPKADVERVVDKPAPPPIWPLTGLPSPSSDTPVKRRLVSVKIDNSPVARPQSGLQAADVVYESITEGGITRFNCFFHSQVPRTVGPVRSARLIDVKVVPQYAALFAFSGANSRVNAAVRAAAIDNLSQDAGVRNGYSRSRARRAPHNLYLDLTEIRAEAVRRGFSPTQTIRPLAFERGSDTKKGAIAAKGISIPFSPGSRVEWTYDASRDVYVRVNNGAVHKDALTGEQIHAKNVVVMWAKVTPAAPAGTYDIQMVGSNRASVFRNGVRIDGTWRATASAPPTFTAADGTPIRLTPGNTWFQVVSTDVNITIR